VNTIAQEKGIARLNQKENNTTVNLSPERGGLSGVKPKRSGQERNQGLKAQYDAKQIRMMERFGCTMQMHPSL
jgi:hypothetical protein